MVKIGQKCLALYMKTHVLSIIMKCFQLNNNTTENTPLYVHGNMFSIYIVDKFVCQQYRVNTLLSFHANYILLNSTKNALLLATNLPVTMLQRLFYIVENDIYSSTTHREHIVVFPWQQWLNEHVPQCYVICTLPVLYFLSAEYKIAGTEEALREYQESGIIIDASALKRPLKVYKHPWGT